jgi:DNA-binding transcriptional LysR family regulator
MLNSSKIDTLQLDLLRTFVVVASSRTFTGAAQRRHVTVSAISQQIRALEGQLGFALFERIGRRARLTDEGRRLHLALETELDRIDEIVRGVTSRSTSVRGRLTLGAPRTFAARWLRPRLSRLLVDYPELRLEVDFAPPAELERRLVEGELDLALLARPVDAAGLVAEPVFDLVFVAVASRSYLARRGHPTTLSEFSRHSYLAFDRERSMLAEWWRAAFGARAPLPDDVVCQVRSIEELLALAEAGLGITVLPEYSAALSTKEGRVVALRAGKRSPRSAVYLAWRRAAAQTMRLQAVRAALSGGDRNRGSRDRRDHDA